MGGDYDDECATILSCDHFVLFRMAELQVQLKRSQDKFLDDIRTTTRVFGQHLDSTIQSLHQSNARFAKSFQLVNNYFLLFNIQNNSANLPIFD